MYRATSEAYYRKTTALGGYRSISLTQEENDFVVESAQSYEQGKKQLINGEFKKAAQAFDAAADAVREINRDYYRVQASIMKEKAATTWLLLPEGGGEATTLFLEAAQLSPTGGLIIIKNGVKALTEHGDVEQASKLHETYRKLGKAEIITVATQPLAKMTFAASPQLQVAPSLSDARGALADLARRRRMQASAAGSSPAAG